MDSKTAASPWHATTTRRPWILGLAGLALLGVLGVFSAQASAAPVPLPQPDSGPPGPTLPTPTSPNDCAQACFDRYLANQARCKSLWCEPFLFFFKTCDSANLTLCMAGAAAVFDDCLSNCDGNPMG